jgi:hypothetical protein
MPHNDHDSVWRFMSLKLGTALSLAAAVLLGLAGQARAATTDNLQHLKDTNGSLTIGDKTFSDFDFQTSRLTNFDASQIKVTASFNNNNGVYYLTWGGNMSLVSNSGPASADLLLNYRVTAAAGLIDTIDQLYTGSAQPSGGAFLSIDETARDANGNLVARSHLQADDLSDPFAEPGDDLNIDPPQSLLDITKDIGFGISANDGGFVTITEIRQSFHQVPEASTAAMLVLGLALVGITIFRQKLRA